MAFRKYRSLPHDGGCTSHRSNTVRQKRPKWFGNYHRTGQGKTSEVMKLELLPKAIERLDEINDFILMESEIASKKSFIPCFFYVSEKKA
jgi:hypothetical protein